MKNTDIEKALKEYYTAEAQSLILPKDDILARISEIKVTNAMPKRKRIFNYKYVAILAACAVLLLGIFAGMYIHSENNTVVSVVSIDVNPGVEIKLNKNDVVVEITALNGDGQDIIADLKLEGSDVETTLSALIGSMLKSGYITEFQNSVLISIENDNNSKNQDLRKKINAIICSLLEDEGTLCAVVTQRVVENDADVRDLAEKFGISIGKAQMVLSLCNYNPDYSAESLAKLSINELTLLLENSTAEINGELSGSASKKSYITALAAKNAAITYLETAHSLDVKNQRVTFDFDNENMFYLVTMETEDFEYKVKVNATDGHILGFGKYAIEVNAPDTSDPETSKPETNIPEIKGEVEFLDIPFEMNIITVPLLEPIYAIGQYPWNGGIRLSPEELPIGEPVKEFWKPDEGDPSYNEWITKYTDEWFEDNWLIIFQGVELEFNVKHVGFHFVEGQQTTMIFIYDEGDPDFKWDRTYGTKVFIEIAKKDVPYDLSETYIVIDENGNEYVREKFFFKALETKMAESNGYELPE